MNDSVFVRRLVLISLGLMFGVGAALAQNPDQPECRLGGNVPNLSVNCPDLYAWQVFAQVVQPIDKSRPQGEPTFASWSSDPDTFQCPPATKEACDKDPKTPGCPVWPPGPREMKPSAATQRSAIHPELKAMHGTTLRLEANADSHQINNCWLAGNVEIVFRNKATFDYIFQQGLWYQEGNAQAFLREQKINFPIDAIEVKTNWQEIKKEQAPRYQTTVMDGKLYGLVAMHISTKALPNWFWSTFEHVDNPGRCDFLGCRDSFGFTPAFVPPHRGPQCGQYPPGEPTAGWKELGLPEQYRYYRLKGSMTDFTSATGRPVLLGNSVTEATFVQTASCMTCHSRATVGVTGVNPYPEVAGFTPDSQSYNGTPDPSWYYANLDPGTTWSLQTDFVWAIPFKAFSASASKACCASGFPGSAACGQ